MVGQPLTIGIDALPAGNRRDSQVISRADVVDKMLVDEHSTRNDIEVGVTTQIARAEPGTEQLAGGHCSVPARTIAILVEVAGDNERQVREPVTKATPFQRLAADFDEMHIPHPRW